MTLSNPKGVVAGVQHRPPAGAKNRRFWGGRSGLFGWPLDVATYMANPQQPSGETRSLVATSGRVLCCTDSWPRNGGFKALRLSDHLKPQRSCRCGAARRVRRGSFFRTPSRPPLVRCHALTAFHQRRLRDANHSSRKTGYGRDLLTATGDMMAILVSVCARILIVDPEWEPLYTEVLFRALRAAERDAKVRSPVKADHA